MSALRSDQSAESGQSSAARHAPIESERGFFAQVREALGRYFVTGILVFAPIAVTIWSIFWIFQKLDNILLPHVLRLVFPGVDEPPRLPLVGALFTIAVVLALGVIARHFFGAEVVRVGERILKRVPIARSIYAAVKQLTEAIFLSRNHQGFRRVVMIEYPRQGTWAIAFTTGPAGAVVQAATPQTLTNCFVPTTPNPTSGFYLLVPEEQVHPLDITVEDAFKLVMSGGLVTPESRHPKTVETEQAS